MELLDKLVLPQSSEHIQLLHFLLMLVLFLFIPFLGAVLGGTFFSIYLERAGRKGKNDNSIRLAKDIIEIVTINKSMGVILGVVPPLAAVLILAQLLHKSGLASVELTIYSFVLIGIGIIFIYAYRYSVTFSHLFEQVNTSGDKNVYTEINYFKESTKRLRSKSGKYGFIILLLGMWVFISALSLAAYPLKWSVENYLSVIFSWEVILRLLQFVSVSLAITGAAVLFSFFYWEGGKKEIDEDYKKFVGKFAIKIALIGALLQPVFLALNLFTLPAAALSGSVFGFSVVALILLLLAYNYLYAMIKKLEFNYSGHVFFILLFALVSLIIKDQLAMSNATKPHSLMLSIEYEKYLNELQGERHGIAEISGKEIFDTRCTPCHRFDQKLVGPAYNDVLPKYEGKSNQLIAFIKNPVKVDPAFPPMPNPGLKPNEIEAVVKYLLEQRNK